MIDLSAFGLSAVQTPPHGGKRDQAGASQDDGKANKNFGDFINEAGKKNLKKTAADDHATAKPGIDQRATVKHPGSMAHVSPKDGADGLEDTFADLGADAVDLDAAFAEGKDSDNLLKTEAAKTGADEAQGRVRLSAGFQQLMKSSAEGGVLHQADQPKAEVKSEKIENKKEQTLHKDEMPAIKEKSAASPSEELQALLGLVPNRDDTNDDAVEKTDEKHAARTSPHDAKDEQTVHAKTEHAVEMNGAEAKADTAGVQQAAAQQAAAHHAATQTVADVNVAADADGNAKPESDADKVRLVSNDGKGRPGDIELGKTAHDDSTAASSGKTDFVTVLDSRRYLGFSNDSGSNAAALTNAIKSEPSWAQVIHNVNTGANQTATEVNTLKLQMNPEHLGNMTASLRLKGDELSVEVRVETADAYRQLSHDQDSIVKALKDQGFSIDQVSIQLSPSARSDSGQSSGNQNQPGTGGQNPQEGGQGDNTRQRDESARRNPNQNNWIGNDRTSSLSNFGSGVDDTDSGNLYL